jgi:hypothetical protein
MDWCKMSIPLPNTKLARRNCLPLTCPECYPSFGKCLTVGTVSFTSDFLTHIVPLSNTARLYQAALKPVTSLANGESLRTLYTAHLSTLTQIEKFLLLAAYISANNPVKYDVKIFGSIGKRARVRKTQNQKMERIRYPTPKLFPLDRMLAIFYFISAHPASMPVVQSAVTRLVKIQLLHRVTGLVKLDAPKYRCNISIDVATMVSRDLTFDLQKYLLV